MARPMQVDVDLLGVSMILLMILGCLVIWEGMKWLANELSQEWLPGASKRKLRKLRKLRDATTQAIERELERLSNEAPRDTRTSTTESDSTSSRRPGSPTTTTSRPTRAPRTPSPTTSRRENVLEASVRVTPASPSPCQGNSDAEEVHRVCVDLAGLMRCEELREALRLNGLQTSGLKGDLCARLGAAMASMYGRSNTPTVRQYKYLLWLWRHRDLQGRTLLAWDCIVDRQAASRTIQRWDQL